MWVVYMHNCKINNKKYIGITSQEPYTRRFNCDGSGYKTSIRFWNAINKYGWENFDHIVLKSNIEEIEAKELEKFYIALFRTMDDRFGYNIKEGGQGEHLPEYVKEKIRKSNLGKPGTNNGKHFTEEHKQKLSETQKGRKMSEKHYENFLIAMSKRKGKPGRKLSESDKKKLIDSSKKKVVCVETGIVYESMTECATAFGVLVSNLSRAIKDKRKYKGYHFEIVYS